MNCVKEKKKDDRKNSKENGSKDHSDSNDSVSNDSIDIAERRGLTFNNNGGSDASGDTFEQVFHIIGKFGPFQFWTYFISLSAIIFCGIQGFANNILVTKPKGNFSCLCPSDLENANQTQYEAFDGETSKNSYDPTNPCNFSAADDRASVVAAFRLVCGRAYLARLPNLIFFLGMFFGSYSLGYLSDKFGRRIVYRIMFVTMILSMTLIASPMWGRFEIFLLLRFVGGLSAVSLYLALFVLGMEISRSKRRTLVGIIPNFPYALGIIIAGVIAAFLDDWRHLALGISLPGLILLIGIFSMPESPRWLLSKDKISELKTCLLSVAATNKKLTSASAKELEGIVDDIAEEREKEKEKAENKVGVRDLFKTRQMAAKTLIVAINWLACAAVYFGATINIARMDISPILGLIVSGSSEILAEFILLLILDRLGRKVCHSTAMLMTGVVCLASIFAASDETAFALSMIGKLFITSAFVTIFIYSAEIFPTVLRNTGMGISSLVARIGTIVAPILVDFSTSPATPLLIFGFIACIAGLLSLFLPETAGHPMPETFQDAEGLPLESPLAVFRRNPCRRPEGKAGEGMQGRGAV